MPAAPLGTQYAIIEGGLAPEFCDTLNAAIAPLREHIADRDTATAEKYTVPDGCDPGGELVDVVTESGLEMKVDVPPQATPGSLLHVGGPGADPVWGVYGHAGDPTVGMGEMVGNQRFHLNLPFVAPFASPEVVEHPLVMRFMEKLWGDEEPALTVLYCNGPSPGSTFQKWHRDSATDFYDL